MRELNLDALDRISEATRALEGLCVILIDAEEGGFTGARDVEPILSIISDHLKSACTQLGQD